MAKFGLAGDADSPIRYIVFGVVMGALANGMVQPSFQSTPGNAHGQLQ